MTIHLVDLGDIVSIVGGSMAGVLAFFAIIRKLFLDKLTKGRLDADQQNTLYHLLVWLIIAGLIVVQAILKNYQLNVMLVASALVAAWPIQMGVNLIFNGVQQASVSSGQQSTTLSTFAPDPSAPIVLPDTEPGSNASA